MNQIKPAAVFEQTAAPNPVDKIIAERDQLQAEVHLLREISQLAYGSLRTIEGVGPANAAMAGPICRRLESVLFPPNEETRPGGPPDYELGGSP